MRVNLWNFYTVFFLPEGTNETIRGNKSQHVDQIMFNNIQWLLLMYWNIPPYHSSTYHYIPNTINRGVAAVNYPSSYTIKHLVLKLCKATVIKMGVWLGWIRLMVVNKYVVTCNTFLEKYWLLCIDWVQNKCAITNTFKVFLKCSLFIIHLHFVPKTGCALWKIEKFTWKIFHQINLLYNSLRKYFVKNTNSLSNRKNREINL